MQIKKLLVGMFLGFGLIVPGISVTATTMLLNVYDDYIELVRNFYNLKIIKKNIFMILGLIIGIIITIVFVNNLYKKVPFLLNGIFLGILVSCIINELKILKSSVAFSLCKTFSGVLIVLVLNIFLKLFNINTISYFSIIISGAFSSLAFIIPGISGGLILLSFNLYYYFIDILINLLNFNFKDLNYLLIYMVSLIFFVFINSRIFKIKTRSYFTFGLLVSSIYLMFLEHVMIINYYKDLIIYFFGIVIGMFIVKLFNGKSN